MIQKTSHISEGIGPILFNPLSAALSWLVDQVGIYTHGEGKVPSLS